MLNAPRPTTRMTPPAAPAAAAATTTDASARWRGQPWPTDCRNDRGVVRLPFAGADGSTGQVTHTAGSHLAAGSFANVYAGVDDRDDRSVVVKYMKHREAYEAQVRADRLLEGVAARNPLLRDCFIWSLGWFCGNPERHGSRVYQSQGVVQRRLDRLVQGDAWARGLIRSPDRTRPAAAYGLCLANVLLELNRHQPLGQRVLHTDIKPSNVALAINPAGEPTRAVVFDVSALRQEGRRFDGFELTIPYNDTDTLRDPQFATDLLVGAASTQIDRHHTHSVACNVLTIATGIDDDNLGTPQERSEALAQVRDPALRALLSEALGPQPLLRPSLEAFRRDLATLAGVSAPATSVPPATPSPTPWYRRLLGRLAGGARSASPG